MAYLPAWRMTGNSKHRQRMRGQLVTRDLFCAEGSVTQAGRLEWYYLWDHQVFSILQYIDGRSTNVMTRNIIVVGLGHLLLTNWTQVNISAWTAHSGIFRWAQVSTWFSFLPAFFPAMPPASSFLPAFFQLFSSFFPALSSFPNRCTCTITTVNPSTQRSHFPTSNYPPV